MSNSRARDGALLSTARYDAWGRYLKALDGNGQPVTLADPFGDKGQYGYFTDPMGDLHCTDRDDDPDRGTLVDAGP